MPFDQAHKQYETARHLPPPLYVLFVQASAYGQACGEHQGGSVVLSRTARGCHQLGMGGSAPPMGQISLLLAESAALGTFWEVLFVSSAGFC